MPPQPLSFREHVDSAWVVLRRPWKLIVTILSFVPGLIPDEAVKSVVADLAPRLVPVAGFLSEWWLHLVVGLALLFILHAWWKTRELWRDLGEFEGYGVQWKVYEHKIQPQSARAEGPFCPEHRTRLMASSLDSGNLEANEVTDRTVIGHKEGRRPVYDESGYLYCPEPGCGLMTFLGLPVEGGKVFGWTTAGSMRHEIESLIESRLTSRAWRLRRRLPAWLKLTRN